MEPNDDLRWNSEPDSCDDCGRPLAPQSGYRLYTDKGKKILCPDCYQHRLTMDTGGSTHDLIAEVDGGSG